MKLNTSNKIKALAHFGPIIANAVREYLTVVIQAATSDGLFHRFRRFQFCARILIPETEGTIGTNRSQCAVHRMERNIVYLRA
jgi:hypothetical protein